MSRWNCPRKWCWIARNNTPTTEMRIRIISSITKWDRKREALFWNKKNRQCHVERGEKWEFIYQLLLKKILASLVSLELTILPSTIGNRGEMGWGNECKVSIAINTIKHEIKIDPMQFSISTALIDFILCAIHHCARHKNNKKLSHSITYTQIEWQYSLSGFFKLSLFLLFAQVYHSHQFFSIHATHQEKEFFWCFQTGSKKEERKFNEKKNFFPFTIDITS